MDLETTGLGENDEIIEIGAVKPDGKGEQIYHQLVNPATGYISPRIFKLCRGISEANLRGSPFFDDIRDEFLEFIGDLPLVCHNATFEKRMLERALGRELENTLLDSLELLCLFKPHFPSHGLQYLLRSFVKEESPEAHRALVDARDTMKLVKKLFSDLAGKDYALLEGTLQIMQGTKWGWLPFLQEISPATLRQETARAATDDGDEPWSAFSLDDLEQLLKNRDNWQKYFPGYLPRPQQLQMALCVADSLRDKLAVFIEAPTGSGKTLAYLLAALIFAVEEKEQVFISTNTKNLQQQVLAELPKVAAVLGIANLRFSDMKGISNYACRRRIEEETSNPGGDLQAKLARSYLQNWARRTASGALEDISYWFRLNNPALNILINLVGCRREDCHGHACNFKDECFYRRKVEMMRSAHLCLINHSLLLTWPGGYPKVKNLIIDEAHTLEGKAFEAFTREVSSHELRQFLGRLILGEDKGYLAYLRFYGRKFLPALDITPMLQVAGQIRQHADDISLLLEPLQNGSYMRRMGIPKDYPAIEEATLTLSSSLAAMARFLEETMAEIAVYDEDFEKTTLYLQGGEYFKTCYAWSGLLETCFGEKDDENSCCYLENSSGGWSFRIAPLDVAELFYNKVLSQCDRVTLTSATLAENGGYERQVEALGFDRMKRERLAYIDPLPGVYDYRQNSVLAIPCDSPGYSDDGFVDYAANAVISAGKMLRGRTMALFTSIERMQRVIDKARAPLEKEGISVLGGAGSFRRGDLNHFKEDENAVLFGSRGFFEGVDISGPALSCIIIDKLSFPFQDDPLLRARAGYLGEMGRNPFNELLLAEVKRTLRQQFGRLIRSETDRGFVLVLDQLDGRKRYSSSVLKELPDTRILYNLQLEEIIGFMKEKYIEWGYECSR